MHDPREPHLTALKRLLRYLRGTVGYGLLLHRRSSSTEMVVYTDADWAGCPDTRRSTSGYAIFLGGNLVSWSSKRQQVALPLQCRGGVPRRGKWRGGGLLAPTAPGRAPQPSSPEHACLL
jgi:hypothetical protein